MNTISGSSTIRGIPGIRLISSPAITRKIGYDIRSLSLNMESIVTANNNEMITKRLSCSMP